ncbi:hypothetical protein HPB47_024019 [Ixodes persulcatus]|uniref:Uncharacterized protein n=1 Tax=Ixodes persulcatus TaxID=34615 RepID=A0AC60Q5X2_IXOPE|nr:hypothetical protein HPB47_024019 [Ixodes persulcatus]
MDNRLQHMLMAYRSIYRRWKETKKKYPKLRRWAAKLISEIEEYAQQLNQQQWQQMCDELQGRLQTKRPWSLFRYMMAPDDTKLEKRKLLTKLVRELDGGDIYARLRSLYLESPQPATPLPTASTCVPQELRAQRGWDCRLVHAFVLSRIMYAAPYMNLNEGTIKTLDTIIRKAFKTALGLATCTPNDALEQLGLHNTFEEMRLAQRTAQEQRLSKTATGLITLQRIGVKQSKKEVGQKPILATWHRALRVIPLPKNTNSARDQGRREARARALDTLHNGQEHVYHADAGTYPSEENKCVVAVYNVNCTTTASVRASNVDEAKEAAIALALNLAAAKGHHATITSHSRSAIMNLSNGKAGPAARNQLLKTTPKEEASYSLTWVPGHSGHSGNEGAHSLVVRAQTIRTNGGRGIPTTDGDHDYGASPLTRGPVNYNEILRNLRIRRKIMGEPHKKLTRLQESTWRRLQLRNSLTPRTLSRSWPDLFKENCEECGFADGSWGHTY